MCVGVGSRLFSCFKLSKRELGARALTMSLVSVSSDRSSSLPSTLCNRLPVKVLALLATAPPPPAAVSVPRACVCVRVFHLASVTFAQYYIWLVLQLVNSPFEYLIRQVFFPHYVSQIFSCLLWLLTIYFFKFYS